MKLEGKRPRGRPRLRWMDRVWRTRAARSCFAAGDVTCRTILNQEEESDRESHLFVDGVEDVHVTAEVDTGRPRRLFVVHCLERVEGLELYGE